MLKIFCTFIFLCSFNRVLSMEGLYPTEKEKMEIDSDLSQNSTSSYAGKRERNEDKQSKDLVQQAKKSKIELADNNLFELLPVELRLMILSYVVKNNKSIGQCFRNLYAFGRVNKEISELIKNESNLNSLLKFIAYEINEDNIFELLKSPKMILVKAKLKKYIYENLFRDKEYMIGLFEKIVDQDLHYSIKVFGAFVKECLIFLVKDEKSNEIGQKVLEWLKPITNMIREKVDLVEKMGPKENEFQRFIVKVQTERKLFANLDAYNQAFWEDTKLFYKNNIKLNEFIIELLVNLQQNADNKDAREAFKMYCCDDSIEILEFLILRGFDIKHVLALVGEDAIEGKNFKVLKYLIENGAELNPEGQMRRSHLITSCMMNDEPEFVEYLLQKGIKFGMHDINAAVVLEKDKILKLLVDHVLSPNFSNLDQAELGALVVSYLDSKTRLRVDYQELIKQTIIKFVPNWDPNQPFDF